MDVNVNVGVRESLIHKVVVSLMIDVGETKPIFSDEITEELITSPLMKMSDSGCSSSTLSMQWCLEDEQDHS